MAAAAGALRHWVQPLVILPVPLSLCHRRGLMDLVEQSRAVLDAPPDDIKQLVWIQNSPHSSDLPELYVL